jgi:putative transposase
MRNKKWLRLVAYVTGSVNQALLVHNEYLAAEKRILRAKLPSRLRSSDPERVTFAEIGRRGTQREVACAAKANTILAWYRRLVAKQFYGSQHRKYLGRPSVQPGVELW